MNTSGFIAIVVALGLGFVGGYRYATRPVPDANPEGPRTVVKPDPIKPPDKKKLQSPERREIHPVTEPDTVCLAADAALTLRGLSGYGLEGVASLRRPLMRSFVPAVAYVDPATERLAVTRTRQGSIRIPYTWRGRTIVDEYAFYPPKWNLSLELEGLLLGDSFAALSPKALQGSAMAWLRIRRLELGVGVRAQTDDHRSAVFSAAGVRYRPWSLR